MIVARGTTCPRGWNPQEWNRRGVPGPAGPAGLAGSSAAFSRYRNGPIDATRSLTKVLELEVPAGAYVVIAKVVAVTKLRKGSLDRWAFTVKCRLEVGNDSDTSVAGDTTEEIYTRLDSATLALTAVHLFSGAGLHEIYVKCTDAPGTRYAELSHMKVTAIQVGTLINTPQFGGVKP
jgi:hypothetical protein